MAKNMSVARISQLGSAKAGSAERHNERKNKDYENMNVDLERSEMNVHFKDPGEESYMDILRRKEEEGSISTRGLRQDATLFDEMIIDVNTMYFEEHGGYEYAKEFYGEAYKYVCEKYGEENIISAVMHADEINQAVTDDLGYPVYHYHMHVVAMPVVEKQILWSKRCKDESLRGTVKETIHQISHSKKWESRTPEHDDEGNIVLRKNGQPRFIKSYSILQDELFDHMYEAGFRDFERGERGSTDVNLKALQFQIKKDRERLKEIEAGIETVKMDYRQHKNIFETYSEISQAGKVGITGKVTMNQDDYKKLKNLAKEGLASRSEVYELKRTINQLGEKYSSLAKAYSHLEEKYDQLSEICKPFLDALKHFPEKVNEFKENVKVLFEKKRERETQEKQERVLKRQLTRKGRSRDDDFCR